MKFIALTSSKSKDPIYFNTRQIAQVFKDPFNGRTLVVSGGVTVEVQETIAEILESVDKA